MNGMTSKVTMLENITNCKANVEGRKEFHPIGEVGSCLPRRDDKERKLFYSSTLPVCTSKQDNYLSRRLQCLLSSSSLLPSWSNISSMRHPVSATLPWFDLSATRKGLQSSHWYSRTSSTSKELRKIVRGLQAPRTRSVAGSAADVEL